MMIQPSTDLESGVQALYASCQQDSSGDPIILTAAATEDGVEVTGSAIDRQGYDSCVLAITALAKLAATKLLSLGVKYQDSADNSTWNAAVVMQASTTLLTGGGGGTTEEGEVELGLNLRGLERYVRFNITPDLDATGTDTAIWSAVCVLGGKEATPVT